MKKNKFIKIFLLTLTLTFFTLTCFAAEFDGESNLSLQNNDDYDGYIVTLKSDVSLSSINLMSPELADVVLTESELCDALDEAFDEISTVIPELGIIKVENEEMLSYLEQCGVVEKSEPNIYLYLQGYDYSQNADFSNQWGHTAVKSNYAWNAGIFGTDVKVAVIDSGVYPNADIVENLLTGYNYVDGNEETSDIVGHGTFVAGIIAAQCNDINTVGLAHRAKIVPLKITDGSEVGLSKVIQAIREAVDKFDCDVLNLSFGTSTNSESLYSAVTYAVSKGAVVVAAAGNYGVTDFIYPASYDNVISVGNVKRSGSGYAISSTSQHNEKVDIAAPGTDVYSLKNEESGSKAWTGTSFSCPYVSAAAALVKSIAPETNCSTFKYVLKRSADASYKTAEQDDEYWGAGLLDVKALLKLFLKDNGNFYVSSPDKQTDKKNTSIYITNLTEKEAKLGNMVLFTDETENGAARLKSVKWIPVTLGADKSLEISFNAYGMFGNVKYTMLTDSLKPLFKCLKTVKVD